MIRSILNPKKKRDFVNLGIIASSIFLILGYLILEFVSTQEEPPLGTTFQIFLGSTLSCIGALGIVIGARIIYKERKRRIRNERKRRKHKIVFLKHKQHEKNSD